FPVFLYTHARLVDEALQPRGIFVHGWITGSSGLKLSKKETSAKGGRIPPIDDGLDRWGADALRLYYLMAVSPAQDLEFEPEAVDAAAERVADVARLAREALADGDGPPELDAWLMGRTRDWVDRAHRSFATRDLRRAAELLYVEVPALLRRYYARGGTPGNATARLARAWIRFLAPITPHIAEEIAAPAGDGLVAAATLPSPDEFAPAPEAEAREAYLDGVEADLRAVLRAGEGRAATAPTRVYFYVAAPWKRTVESWGREQLARGEAVGVREAMQRLGSHPELAAHRAELPRYVERVGPALRTEGAAPPTPVDEVDALRAAAGYLAHRFALREVAVYPEAEAGPFDPKGRRERARPGDRRST
ncbi:leucyl-tRNA synthetase, partial [mine drainage metagenome]